MSIGLRPTGDDTVPRPPDTCDRDGATRASRGASTMEAAIASMAFFTLLFGIFEGSGLLSHYLGVGNVVTSGVRAASVHGDDARADYHVLRAIKQEGQALKTGSITRIVIYKASGFGAEPSAGCMSGTPSSECNVYSGQDLARPETDFGCVSSGQLDSNWCPMSRKVGTSGTTGPPDYVGVWVQYDHQMYTRFFGSSRTMTDHAVLRLEPRKV